MIKNYLQQVQRDGLQIRNVFDVGACSGQWTQELRHSVLPKSQFYLFEANSAHSEQLNSLGLPFFIGVLSNPGRLFVEFFSKNSTGDSYYKENTVHYDSHPPVKVPCNTLADVMEKAALPIPNLLKIDTQGSELDILKGMEQYLSGVDLIYLECPVIRYNLEAPTLQDYLDYMRENGFVPTEVLEIHKNEQIILQIDIMFINHKTKERIYGPTQYSRPLEN